MKQRATEGMSAERVGLAIGEIIHQIGQPVTFSEAELAAMPAKAQAFIKQRLMVWFDANSAEYTPKPRIYATRVISSTPAQLPALEPEKKPSRFIGPPTPPAMFGTAKAVPTTKNNNNAKAEAEQWKTQRVARTWSR